MRNIFIFSFLGLLLVTYTNCGGFTSLSINQQESNLDKEKDEVKPDDSTPPITGKLNIISSIKESKTYLS